MTRGLAVDLARWERGDLGVDDLAARHPGGGAVELAETHTWLTFLTSEPSGDRGPDWETVAARLGEREDEVRERRAVPVRRIVAAFVAGTVMAPASAFAARSDAVRDVTEGVARRMTQWLAPEPPPAPEAAGEALGSPGEETVATVGGAPSAPTEEEEPGVDTGEATVAPAAPDTPPATQPVAEAPTSPVAEPPASPIPDDGVSHDDQDDQGAREPPIGRDEVSSPGSGQPSPENPGEARRADHDHDRGRGPDGEGPPGHADDGPGRDGVGHHRPGGRGGGSSYT